MQNILMIVAMLVLNGCLMFQPKLTEYSESQHLINSYEYDQKSVDELCQILENIDDPIVNLRCNNDDGNGRITFSKWAVGISVLPIPLIYPSNYYENSIFYDLESRRLINPYKNTFKDTFKDEKERWIKTKRIVIDYPYYQYLKRKNSNKLNDFYEYFQWGFGGSQPIENKCVSCHNESFEERKEIQIDYARHFCIKNEPKSCFIHIERDCTHFEWKNIPNECQGQTVHFDPDADNSYDFSKIQKE